MPNANFTPKAQITFSKVGNDFGTGNISLSGVSTYKVTKGDLTAGITASDKTFTPLGDVPQLKDVVLTGDYRLSPEMTINSKFEPATKRYLAGYTWSGRIGGKPGTLKGWYTSKDQLMQFESSLSLAKNQKATLNLTLNELTSFKYSVTKGNVTLEPSYNFLKNSVAISATQKLGRRDTLKVAYDIKSEAAAIEWAHQPFKLVVATSVSKSSLNVGRPTISAVFEKTFSHTL